MKLIRKEYFVFEKEDRKAFKDFLKENNMTIEDFAKKCGISRQFLSGIINGHQRITQKIVDMFAKEGFRI